MKIDLKTILIYFTGAILMIGLIGFTSRTNSLRPVADLNIEIIHHQQNYFIDQFEVTDLLNSNEEFVLGADLGRLDLKKLEQKVEVNAFVKDAQVYRDIEGNLKVKLEQARPVARILNYKGSDRYIDTEGNLLPLNAKYTARVPIVELESSRSWERNIRESEEGEGLLDMLLFIDGDKFWKAQIAHLVLDKNNEIIMMPQVTKQEIVFGFAADIEEKFKKLKVFYKEVLPAKGWNTYASVNVKFKNQIVCK